MKVSKKVSDAAFKCRGLLWGIFAAGVLICPAKFSPGRFIAGLVILIAGQALRFWAAGYIPKYRTVVIGAPILVTWGPYRWVRNPLYAGNFIMGAGWALMAGWVWVVAFCAAFLVLYGIIIIPAEEDFLEGKFGDSYRDFKSKVPPLFPFPRCGFPEKTGEEHAFSRETAFKEEIYSVRVNIVVTVLIIVRLWFTK